MGRMEYSYLLDYVKGVPDPRKARGKRHSWELILSLICIGLAVGQKTAWAIARWAQYQQTALCGMLKASHIPSYSTFYRALRYIEVDALEAQIAAYGQDVAQETDQGLEADVGRGQSIDGKEIRGASVHGEPHHLLALAQHATATILGQCRVGEGTNEIGALPELLEGRDLTGTVTTLYHLRKEAPCGEWRAESRVGE